MGYIDCPSRLVVLSNFRRKPARLTPQHTHLLFACRNVSGFDVFAMSFRKEGGEKPCLWCVYETNAIGEIHDSCSRVSPAENTRGELGIGEFPQIAL